MTSPARGTRVAARLLQERGVTLLSLDLDDTLLDTDGAAGTRIEAAVARAAEVIPGLDQALAEQALRAAMEANPVTFGRMFAFLGTLGLTMESPQGAAIRAAYNEVLLDALEWLENAEAVLRPLRERYRLAIVTNGPATMQVPKLEKFGLRDLVDYVVVSGEVGVSKPDPRIFEHLLTTAGTEAPRAAHVGDSIDADIAGARAAGLTSIWLPPRGREPDDPGEHVPDAIIERLEDLLAD